MNETVVGRLAKCRKGRRATQKQAAELLAVTEQQWQRYEYGENYPTVRRLIAIADVFGVSTDYLLGRSDDKPEDLGVSPQTPQGDESP